MSMLPHKLTRLLAVGAVAVSLASGGLAVSSPSAGNAASGTANAAQTAQGLRAGMGEIIRGEAADKAIAEALDAKNKGRVNQGHGNRIARADSATR
jgi:hypothetical protein